MSSIRSLKKILGVVLSAFFFSSAGIIFLGLVFYASGYRYNFQTHKIQKTGLLVITKIPEGSSVLIDGHTIDVRNHRTLPAFGETSYSAILLPGRYELQIKKEGYTAHSERIIINPEKITKISNIYFLSTDIQTRTDSSVKAGSYSISPNDKWAIMTNENNVVTTLNNQNKELATYTEIPAASAVRHYSWNNLGDKVLVHTESKSGFEIYAIDLLTQKVSALSDIFSFVPTPDTIAYINDADIIIFSNSILYRLNLSTKITDIVDTDVVTSSQADTKIYYTKKDHSLHTFNTSNGNISRLPFPFFTISPGPMAVRSIGPDTFLIINGTLFHLNEKGLTLLDLDIGIHPSFTASSGRKIMFIHQKFEVKNYDLDTALYTLVTRKSNEIRDILPLGDSPYIAYVAENTVSLMRDDGTNDISVYKTQDGSIRNIGTTDDATIWFVVRRIRDASTPTIERISVQLLN